MTNTQQIKKLILQHTDGTGLVLWMAGERNRSARRELLTLIIGRKIPGQQAGIHRLFDTLVGFAGINTQQCVNSQEQDLQKWVKS